MKTLLLFLFLMSLPAVADLLVVVNKNNQQAITAADIKKIYLGKTQTFSDGSKVVPAMYSEGTYERTFFIKQALRVSESQYIGVWAKLLFTGNGLPPAEQQNSQSMISFILNEPQAIGYLPRTEVDDRFRVIAEFSQDASN